MVGNLSTVRKNRNMTQEELAAASGINRVTIAKYETGRQEPTVANALKLATALGVTVDELIGAVDKWPGCAENAKNTPVQPTADDDTLEEQANKGKRIKR